MSRTPKVEAERIRRWLEWSRAQLELCDESGGADGDVWYVPDVLRAILDGEEPPT